MYLLYGSARTSIHLHMYTPSHTDSLEHFSTCRYNPHAVSPQWSQYSGLLWGMDAGLKSWPCPSFCTSVLSINVAWASKGSWYFAGGLRLISGAEYWTEYAFETPLRFLGLCIFKVSLTLANESSGPLWLDVGLERSFTESLGSLLGDGALGCAKIPPPFFLTLLRFGDALLGDALPLCWEYTSNFFPLPLGVLFRLVWGLSWGLAGLCNRVSDRGLRLPMDPDLAPRPGAGDARCPLLIFLFGPSAKCASISELWISTTNQSSSCASLGGLFSLSLSRSPIILLDSRFLHEDRRPTADEAMEVTRV